MNCYGCGKLGHLIADCYVSRGQAGGAKTSRGNTYKNKKSYSKTNNKNNFKKPYEKKRQQESDQYDTGNESDNSVQNRSVHQAPSTQMDIQNIQNIHRVIQNIASIY